MSDYCSAPDELAKNPHAHAWMKEIANGNHDALSFMMTWWSFTHIYDDLVDNDKPVTAEQASGQFIAMLYELWYNPFVQQHRDRLFPLIVSMFNRWVDGDEWERRDDDFSKIASSVIRCGDIDLYHVIAYLTGGWENMRRTRGARSYDRNKSEVA